MIAADVRRALTNALGDRVRFGAPLAAHTSLRVGGPAEALAVPADRDELARVLAICATHHIPVTVLGGGFNTLVLDGGIEGLVLRTQRLRRLEAPESHAITAEAGVSHSQITNLCLRKGWSGLEFAAGIPGTVGGWLAMNAGVPEREMKDVVREIEVLEPGAPATRVLVRDELDFRYRRLTGLPAGAVLVAARFACRPSSPEAVRAEVERLLARRRATQPLDLPSCGSVFQNPPGERAGRLIELAGLKGERVGDAEISSVHANFIVNRGRASARDVVTLIHRVRDRVLQQTGIALEPEVRLVGRES